MQRWTIPNQFNNVKIDYDLIITSALGQFMACTLDMSSTFKWHLIHWKSVYGSTLAFMNLKRKICLHLKAVKTAGCCYRHFKNIRAAAKVGKKGKHVGEEKQQISRAWNTVLRAVHTKFGRGCKHSKFSEDATENMSSFWDAKYSATVKAQRDTTSCCSL